MNNYLFIVLWQLAVFGLMIAAAVAAYLTAKGLRLLLFSGVRRSSVPARLFSLVVGLGVLTLLAVFFSFVMDRTFASVLSYTQGHGYSPISWVGAVCRLGRPCGAMWGIGQAA